VPPSALPTPINPAVDSYGDGSSTTQYERSGEGRYPGGQ